LLRGVEGIGVIELTGSDVIRHPLVKRVISAFEKMEADAQMRKDQFAKRTDSPAN
ncbi:MAG: PhoH-like protein, partial [Bacteroidota bacterium]